VHKLSLKSDMMDFLNLEFDLTNDCFSATSASTILNTKSKQENVQHRIIESLRLEESFKIIEFNQKCITKLWFNFHTTVAT